MGCASLRSDVLPPFKSSAPTTQIGWSHIRSWVIPLRNRVTTPLKVLLPLNPSPSTTESELPHRNPSCSTSGVGCSYLCNRVVSPLMVLLPLYPCCPTSEGAPATESGPFYHQIRTATQEPELFHIRNRAIPPLNPARNLKSQGEFTASRQI